MEIAAGVLLFASAALAVAFAIRLYNGLGRVRGELRRAWSRIDVLLQQRHDELAAVEEVARLRADYDLAPTSGEKTEVENRLNRALAGLRPPLELQARIAPLESAIAEQRTSFNGAVILYNAYLDTHPQRLFLKALGFTPHAPLEAQRAIEAQLAPPPPKL